MLGMAGDEFAAVTSSEDVDRSKPEPDILATALQRAGGADAVVVGSALVRQIAEHGADRGATETALRDTLSAMRRAIDEQDNTQGEARRA